MADYDVEVRRLLSKDGYEMLSRKKRGKGSHEVWFSAKKNIKVSVNNNMKSRYTANDILEQAGINYKF